MKHKGYPLAIVIEPLSTPFGITSMDIEYDVELICESKGLLCKEGDLTRQYFVRRCQRLRSSNRVIVECPDVNAQELFDEKWITVRVKLTIKNIYDTNETAICTEEWHQYGFFQ